MSIDELKSSGLLELYVIGDITESEVLMVEQALIKDPALKQEIIHIEHSLEMYAQHHAEPVAATAKSMFLAVLDYSERIKNGEEYVSVPSLNPSSKISDFNAWINRSDFQVPEKYDSMFGKIISADDQKSTILIWLKYGAPDEVHTNELEKFLVVEGSCDIKIGDQTHSLSSGDFLSIPLHVVHSVKVTSDIPCKIILERTAA
jgi:mannose-6-phosphate isomerase-like protein (cupin superfamily)